MQNQIFIFPFLVLVLACAQTIEQSSPVLDSDVPNAAPNSVNLDSLWAKLLVTRGGCLVGLQDYQANEAPVMACVLYGSPGWQQFLKTEPTVLGPFLLEQLGDTTTTQIHTCPFFSASAGELAVYCLQKVYHINWYDFDSFQAYAGREITSSEDQPQRWLQAILEDETQRMVMADHWLQRIKLRPVPEE